MSHDFLVQMAYCTGVETSFYITSAEIIQICFLYYFNNYLIIIIIIYNVFHPLFWKLVNLLFHLCRVRLMMLWPGCVANMAS